MRVALPSFKSLIVLYVFRLMHIGSMVGLAYKIINDYLTQKLSTDHSLFFGMIGVGVMVSGRVLLLQRFCEYIFVAAKKDGRGQEIVGIMEPYKTAHNFDIVFPNSQSDEFARLEPDQSAILLVATGIIIIPLCKILSIILGKVQLNKPNLGEG